MLGQSGRSSASNAGTTSTYSPSNAPAYGAGSSPAERQSVATAGAARSRIESETIVPNAWLTDGSRSEAATTGAARSPLSYTIACACHARATSSSAGSFSGAWPCAKRYEKTYGRRSSAGSSWIASQPASNLTPLAAVWSAPAASASNPSASTTGCQDAAVANAISWPRARRALASGSSGRKCPSSGVVENSTRIRRSSRESPGRRYRL